MLEPDHRHPADHGDSTGHNHRIAHLRKYDRHVHHQVVDQSCRHHGNERFLQRVPDQCDVDHDEYHLNSNAQRKHQRNIIDSDLLDLDALDQQ